MTGEIGQLALCLALALALVEAIAGLAGARVSATLARRVASSSAAGLLVFVGLAFGALTYASVTSDFSILNVAQNSHTLKPLIYKISGVWGNHEGSMLLWVLVLAIYSAAVAFAKRGSERLTSAALGVQGLVAAAFILFILFTSNPFVRLDPAPFEGDGLNPLLQDFGLAVHPPMLYIGYVGLSAAFAYAAAALITQERDWARAARPFMLAAWIALTLGIALGSWWAYYELGWGGFWFWDPVENASLMPWLFAWRAPGLQTGTAFAPVSRETSLLLNNVFLTAAASTVFVGTLYPLVLDSLTGTKISVGPPYFAATFAPIFFALLVLVPFGPRLSWKKGDLRAALRTLAPAVGIAAVAAVAILAFTTPRALAGAGAFAVAAWLAGASVIDLHRRGFRALPAGAIASALAHAGLAVTLIGVAGTTLWRSEALEVLRPGEQMYIAGYGLRLDGVVGAHGPNYEAARANITVLEGGETIAVMHPERRIFPAERQETVETAIRTTIFSDLYLALGDRRDEKGWTVRAYVNPLAPFIWLGAVVMALGGFASLWGRLRKSSPVPGAVAAAAG